MTLDVLWNVLGVVAMVLLLGVGFMRKSTLLTIEDPKAVTLVRLRLVLIVVGVLTIVATMSVLYATRHRRGPPFNLSPVPAQLDSLRGRVIADSVRFRGEMQGRARREKANAIMLDGVNLAGRGRITAALARYEEAHRIDPSYAAPLENKGYALYRLGRLPEALVALRSALAVNRMNPWTHYNYALALWASGDTAQALDEVEVTLRFDSGFRTTIRDDRQFRPFRESDRFRMILARSSP